MYNFSLTDFFLEESMDIYFLPSFLPKSVFNIILSFFLYLIKCNFMKEFDYLFEEILKLLIMNVLGRALIKNKPNCKHVHYKGGGGPTKNYQKKPLFVNPLLSMFFFVESVQ